MKVGLRRRFYLEVGAGLMTAVLFLVTLAKRDWIEVLVGIDPDRGNGSLEWMIVGGLVVVTLVLFVLAGNEWRRISAAAHAHAR